MLKRVSFLLLFVSKLAFAQHSLDDFINRAIESSPVLKEYHHHKNLNQIQYSINRAENSAFRISLTGNYLFTPYFNNHGDLVTTNPAPQAFGYDINLFDGGLYSAQLNLERNLFNGRLVNVLDRQIEIQDENTRYSFNLEKHNLRKLVTEQYLNAYQALLLTRLATEVVLNLSDQLKLTEDLVEKGFVKTQDYLLL